MFETGCIRAFITLSRRSAVTISRRRESRVMLGSAEVACKTWLRVSTSSPTRFIIRFSSVTSTRSVLSAALPCVRGRAGSCSAASGEALDSAAAAGTARLAARESEQEAEPELGQEPRPDRSRRRRRRWSGGNRGRRGWSRNLRRLRRGLESCEGAEVGA